MQEATGYQHFYSAKIRARLFLIAVCCLVGNTAFARSEAAGAGIRVGIIGDQTGATDLNQAYATLTRGVNILSQRDLDVVIHVGDLLESSDSESAIRAQYATASGILGGLSVPWYMTAGDHDVNPPAYQQDSPDRSREALFQTLYGDRVPMVRKHPYYSFDMGSYHFVALYSHESLHADPRWGNIFLAEVSDRQYRWLATDLESRKKSKAIIVFIHQPLWYNWSAWKRVHDLLRRYPVAAVIAGHFHYDQNEGKVDDIRYVVVGATGGNVKNGDREAGNVHHVTVMKVKSKDSVDFDLIPLTDNAPLQFTPRVDMDKIQAMDIVLGELWNFATTNPVFIKHDGSLVNACNGTDPAKIHITPIGNPTNDAMNVTIGFSANDKNIVLLSAGFVPGQCQPVINDSECQLARSARIFGANNSSVSVNVYDGPLWSATVGSSTPMPQPGATLNFDIRLTYKGKSGPLYLERQVATTIGACP